MLLISSFYCLAKSVCNISLCFNCLCSLVFFLLKYITGWKVNFVSLSINTVYNVSRLWPLLLLHQKGLRMNQRKWWLHQLIWSVLLCHPNTSFAWYKGGNLNLLVFQCEYSFVTKNQFLSKRHISREQIILTKQERISIHSLFRAVQCSLFRIFIDLHFQMRFFFFFENLFKNHFFIFYNMNIPFISVRVGLHY